ncbi:hypothetical protein [Methanoculleus sp.]|uniref:hypothetical protein n=1 Tax=Methanoculleus sp. TaxID=90427 RepID=UPI001BD509DD|nr:hypothetical protein [Methanoculleus sp.]
MSPQTNPESRHSPPDASAPPNALPARENPDRPFLVFAAFSALAFISFGSASWCGAPALAPSVLKLPPFGQSFLAAAPVAVVALVIYFAAFGLKNRF